MVSYEVSMPMDIFDDLQVSEHVIALKNMQEMLAIINFERQPDSLSSPGASIR